MASMAAAKEEIGFVNSQSIHNAGKGAVMEVQTRITLTNGSYWQLLALVAGKNAKP